MATNQFSPTEGEQWVGWVSDSDSVTQHFRFDTLGYGYRLTQPKALQEPAPTKGLSMNKTWLGIFFSVLIWSVINPKDYLTWLLETAPAMMAFIVMVATRQRFRLTGLAYGLMLVLSLILMIGGHYTYAEVPLFEWFKDVFNQDRNNFDKLGHFAQGFVPAIIAREIIIRNHVVKNTSWLNFFVICICLAISAFYEMIEWCVAIVSKEAAEAFLGTQGYLWDTQSDMAYALVGAMVALFTLKQTHDRQISKLLAKHQSFN